MERIRKFEQRIFRACTSLYRPPTWFCLKYTSNKRHKRIDIRKMFLIRNHNLTRCLEEETKMFIKVPSYCDERYAEMTINNCFSPPEIFSYLYLLLYWSWHCLSDYSRINISAPFPSSFRCLAPVGNTK